MGAMNYEDIISQNSGGANSLYRCYQVRFATSTWTALHVQHPHGYRPRHQYQPDDGELNRKAVSMTRSGPQGVYKGRDAAQRHGY